MVNRGPVIGLTLPLAIVNVDSHMWIKCIKGTSCTWRLRFDFSHNFDTAATNHNGQIIRQAVDHAIAACLGSEDK